MPLLWERLIVPSLNAGDLRQGWAYRDDQGLNVIAPIVNDRGHGALNVDHLARDVVLPGAALIAQQEADSPLHGSLAGSRA